MGYVVTWFALSILLGIAFAAGGLALGSDSALDHALWVAPVTGLVFSALWFVGKRAQYQSIWIAGAEQKFSGAVVAWKLGFANPTVADRFLRDNPAAKPC